DLIRFEVQVYDRPANLADWFAMRTVGEGMQASAWDGLVQAMVEETGGVLVGTIQHEDTYLDEQQAERVEEWVRDIVVERKRAENAPPRRAHAGVDSHVGGVVTDEADRKSTRLNS